MTVAELIAWLQTQDQGATVEVLQERSHILGNYCDWVDFGTEQHADYIDLRGNPHVPADASYRDTRSLRLGATA